MYFFDHTLIESTQGQIVPIVLNEKSWPEGLWFGIAKMRKGERSKIKIKKNYGFGTTLDPELLRVPDLCKEELMLTWLKKKPIIYEVVLHDWEIREDLDHDNKVVKIVMQRAKGSFDKPNGIDQVTMNLRIY